MFPTVRLAQGKDLPVAREIERAAGERFREVGLAEVADDEPLPLADLAGYVNRGQAWVAVDEAEQAVGYVLVDIVDGYAHVEQISVLPALQGGGVGRMLLEHVRTWANESNIHAVTLTTFARVPWNAPLYRHIGFRELTADEIGPQLRAVRDAETARGLDPATRVCMIWATAP